MTPVREWVTLRMYGSIQEAMNVEVFLHQHKIPARVLEDTTSTQSVGYYWSTPQIAGGVQLQVKHQDLADACEVLGLPIEDYDDVVHPDPSEEMQREAQRTRNAAVLGLVLCPGISHLWALYLVWTFPYPSEDRDDKTRALLRQARNLSVIVLAIQALLIAISVSK